MFEIIIYILLLFSGIVTGFVLNLIFHECGHLISGIKNKMAFCSMSIGFFIILKTNKGIKIKLSNSKLAGLCRMVPKNTDNVCKKFLSYARGGLYGSLIHLTICVLCLAFFKLLSLNIILLIAGQAAAGIYLCFINFTPTEGRGLKTDGKIIKELKNKEPSAMAAVNILTLSGELYLGKTPAELSQNLLFPPFASHLSPSVDINDIILASYKYCYYLDTENYQKLSEICAYIEGQVKNLHEIYAFSLYADLLYFELIHTKNFEKAKEIYGIIKEYLESGGDLSDFRILAAYELFVNKNTERTEILLKQAEKEAEEYFISGIARFEEKQIKKLTCALRFVP